MLKRSTVYLRAYSNRLLLRHVEDDRTVDYKPTEPFTSRRLLFGEFRAAEAAIREAMNELITGPRLLQRVRVLLHPKEMVEGGVTEIEERIMREAVVTAGVGPIKFWVGSDLSDRDVLSRF